MKLGVWMVCWTVPGLALACDDLSRVYGIPGECRMRTVSIWVPPAPCFFPAVDELHVEDMNDRWTYHAYRPAPDRRRAVYHRRDGIRLARLDPSDPGVELSMDVRQHNPRGVHWRPDSRWFALWTGGPGKRVALVDAEHPARGPTVIYDPAQLERFPKWVRAGETRVPFGLDWAGSGHALYVVERLLGPAGEPLGGAVVRLDLRGAQVTSASEVLRTKETLDFAVAAPHGDGDRLLFGTAAGLYLLNPASAPRRLSELPATGLDHVAWHPHEDLVLLHFRRPTADAEGRVLRGLWLIDLNRPAASEQLDDQLSLHTVTWSPSGRYATWAGYDDAAYRRPADPPAKTVFVALPAPNGLLLELKGIAWKPDETRLALTAEDRLLLHTVGRPGTDELLRLLPSTPGDDLFLAEPCWQGERVVATAFEDKTRAKASAPPPVFKHR